MEFADTILEDLARRDFTCNAMAFSLETGIYDPFGGRADIEAGVLRCVGTAETRFHEDALRIRDQFPSYIPAMQVHGDFPQESIEEMHRLYHNENIRYIGELVPYIMDTGAFDSPGMLTIFKEAGKLGMTVNLHGGTPAEADAMLENAPGCQCQTAL